MTTAIRHKASDPGGVIDPPGAGARPWTVDSAYRYCERLARSHYENFPVGSVLIPARLRKHFYSIYAFARTADDFADEGSEGESEKRLKLLHGWHEMLRRAFAGEASHPVFIALAETRERFGLPARLFEDLISAFVQDLTVRRYQSFAELSDYCRRSANPVGRLVLLLFGHKDERLHLWSDQICTGLQLANHWQDIGVDLDKDRVYVPAEDLERFGLTAEDLKERRADDRFRRLMRFEVGRAREMFSVGKPLCVAVGGRLGMELRAVWLGGSRILDLIESNGFDVFSQRPVITSADKRRILLGAIRKGAFKRI